MRKSITAAIDYEQNLWAQQFRRIVGIDEAGRGAWAGPVAAGAVCLPANDPDLLKKLAGVRDSKQMTPRQRAHLVETIKSVAVSWGIGYATPEEIDQFNILRASCLAMVRALEDAQKRLLGFHADYLLVDSIKCPEIDHLNIAYLAIVKGDQKCLSIAAASVIAKTWRDEYMRSLDRQHPEYEFGIHKGYGTTRHRAALQAFGASAFHRKSFRPLRDLSETSS